MTESGECPSGKVRYPDWEQAAWALEDIRGSETAWKRKKIPVRIYPCDRCGDWHLTSMHRG